MTDESRDQGRRDQGPGRAPGRVFPGPWSLVPGPSRSSLVTRHSLSLRHELARKALHLASAVVPVAYAAGLPRAVLLPALVALLGVALVVELLRHRAEVARALFDRTVGPLLRAHEHHRWAGATWMLLAYVLVVWLAPAPAAVAAMWGVAVGDAAAAIVGRAFGGRVLGGRRFGAAGKSIEGSVACCVATAAGALWVAGLGPAVSVAAGVAAAAAEWPGRPLDDNLRVAAAVALAVVAATWLLTLR